MDENAPHRLGAMQDVRLGGNAYDLCKSCFSKVLAICHGARAKNEERGGG